MVRLRRYLLLLLTVMRWQTVAGPGCRCGGKVATALMAAANVGHEAGAKRLLDHGPDVAAASHKGATALLAAVQGGREAMDKGYWTMAPMWPLQSTTVRLH